MIANLIGKILEIRNDAVIVDVSGIGFLVFIPNSLKAQIHVGENILLHTCLIVRQDLMALYGFESNEEREIFSLLLGVNGVGPRLALAILSTLNPDTIRNAILQENFDVFGRVPGVGKKTAQKILLHLHDRIPIITGLESLAAISDQDSEVLAALTVLGYSVVEAQAALQSIPKDAPQGTEERLKLALQYFS
ncbi:MAG: Holliday junction branch migration protein RuvA [Anaerolineales bacterium]|nr:Holliday junction branch migration protein RuvA [Anaerolineales bacterium]